MLALPIDLRDRLYSVGTRGPGGELRDFGNPTLRIELRTLDEMDAVLAALRDAACEEEPDHAA